MKTAIRRYAAGERDFSNINLTGANLSRADLQDINLRGANLSWVELSFANLSGANLSVVTEGRWGCLSGANLRGANLRGANLDGCEMMGVNLENADLTGAMLGTLESAFIHNTIDREGNLVQGPLTLE